MEQGEVPSVPNVKFKRISGWPDYAVGTDGSVWSNKFSRGWRKLKPKRSGSHRKPYSAVTLRSPALSKQAKIHRLILETFIGECPPGCVAMHYPNPDTSDNRLENLKWGTPSDNVQHSLQCGTHKSGCLRGEAVGNSKLTEEMVQHIYHLASTSMRHAEIAKKYNVSDATVSLISNGQLWSHLHFIALPPKEKHTVGEKNGSAKLTWEQVRQIRFLYSNKKTRQVDLAKKFHVSQILISLIVRNKIWKEVTHG